MKQVKFAKQVGSPQPQPSRERHRTPRVPISFGLTYSDISGDDVLMGDGTAVDLSKGGLGIRGSHPVKVGMELTLFFYLPDGEDPLFVLEARVVWTGKRQFGVEIMKRSLREGNRLHTFLRTYTLQQA